MAVSESNKHEMWLSTLVKHRFSTPMDLRMNTTITSHHQKKLKKKPVHKQILL